MQTKKPLRAQAQYTYGEYCSKSQLEEDTPNGNRLQSKVGTLPATWPPSRRAHARRFSMQRHSDVARYNGTEKARTWQTGLSREVR